MAQKDQLISTLSNELEKARHAYEQMRDDHFGMQEKHDNN